MPRDHARIHLDIWGNDDWLNLLDGKNSLRGIGRIWLREHLPRLAHSGPVSTPEDWRQFPHRADGIYHLLDANGSFLYIGKTCNPSSRFLRHRELKDWWPLVSAANFYVPSCHDHLEDPCVRSSLEKVTFRLEAAAIRHVKPPWNVMGVQACG